ncbi:MAG: pentapeptide repeat-containing protein, partial [Gemmatimonadetes bacterium]|nr:pentapeptide repeat-containing protein [Gemmatimonadota bacterium]
MTMTRWMAGCLALAVAAGACGDDDGTLFPGGEAPAAPRALDVAYFGGAVFVTWEIAPDWDGESFRVYSRQAAATLAGADLRRGNLTGAQLQGASLLLADLQECNLMGANLTRCNLSGTDLRNANLTRAILADAVVGRLELSTRNGDRARAT